MLGWWVVGDLNEGMMEGRVSFGIRVFFLKR
jgi:hypothetical protein